MSDERDPFRKAADETLVQAGQGDPATQERRSTEPGDVRKGGHPEDAPDKEGAATGFPELQEHDDEFVGAPEDPPEGSEGQDSGLQDGSGGRP